MANTPILSMPTPTHQPQSNLGEIETYGAGIYWSLCSLQRIKCLVMVMTCLKIAFELLACLEVNEENTN